MNQNIYSLKHDMFDRAWRDLHHAYIDEGLDLDDSRVIPLNYCGHVVKLDYFLDRGYRGIEEMNNDVPWLKPRIIFYETDPNLKISDAVGDDKEYGAEFLDHYSVHMHRIENSIAIHNTNATVNFPLLNCNEGSTTTWYKLTDGIISQTDYLTRTDETSVEVIEEAHLRDRECSLMRMDRWHSVRNETGKRRVIANWDFCHYVPWDDAVELFIR